MYPGENGRGSILALGAAENLDFPGPPCNKHSQDMCIDLLNGDAWVKARVAEVDTDGPVVMVRS